MGDGLKFVVKKLNEPPFNRNFSLLSFDSLQSVELLQVLTDVLGEIYNSVNIVFRPGEPEQMTNHILGMLCCLNYTPNVNVTPSALCEGLVQGQKKLIHPILEWLLQHMPELKKKAHLAQCSEKVPSEFMGDIDLSAFYNKCEEYIVNIRLLIKETEMLPYFGYVTAEMQKKMEAMERVKQIILKQMERMKEEVKGIPNKEAMLEADCALLVEKKHCERQDPEAFFTVMKQHRQMQNKQLKDIRQSAVGSTPEGLLQCLDEDANVATDLAKQRLPKEIEVKQEEVNIVQVAANKPAMNYAEILALLDKFEQTSMEFKEIMKQCQAFKNRTDDHLAPLHQESAIIAHQKENVTAQFEELENREFEVDEELLSAHENLDGAHGCRETKEQPELTSAEKAAVDQEKEKTSEELSTLILDLEQQIACIKTQHPPLLMETRPQTKTFKEATQEYEEKKLIYDATSADFKSNCKRLEQAALTLRSEMCSNESALYPLQAEVSFIQVESDLLNEEIDRVINESDVKKPPSEELMRCIYEQEKLRREMKENHILMMENQKLMQQNQILMAQNQAYRVSHMKRLLVLQEILEFKLKCYVEAKHREKGAEAEDLHKHD